MNAAKKGYIYEFKTGYLQREIRMELKVTGGTDNGLRNPFEKGFAAGRLVKIDGDYIKPAELTDENLYIIAQTDDTLRGEPKDYNYPERQSYLPNLILKNTDEFKTVALYKVVDKTDLKAFKIAEPVDVLTGIKGSDGFKVAPATFILNEVGINSYVVEGTAPYITTPIVSGNPAGNYLYLKLVNKDLDTGAKFAARLTKIKDTDIVYKRISDIGENTITKSAIVTEIGEGPNGGIEVEACINDTKMLVIEVMWENNVFTRYTFDLTNLAKEAA